MYKPLEFLRSRKTTPDPFFGLRLAMIFIVLRPAYATDFPKPVEGDFTIENFKFESGEVLPELKLHYAVLGTPVRDDAGTVRNAVLVMHGTGGSGRQFLTDQFAGVLFGP